MFDLLEGGGLIGLLAVLLLLPWLLRSNAKREGWSQRVSRERGWPIKRTSAETLPVGSSMSIDSTVKSNGDCGATGSDDCG
jgi:hypothetical protein